MSPEPLDPLILLLWQNSVEITLHLQSQIHPLGLTLHDVRAITVLKEHGPLTAGDLALHLGITNGAVTGSVNRLIRAGVVRRDPGGEDKRQRIISLQRSDLDDALEGISREAMALFDAYTAEERQILLRHYRQIAARLEAIEPGRNPSA